MIRWIDIDDDRNCYIGTHGEYERWNIDTEVLAEAESTDRKGHWMSFEQVADMLSGMLGKCACDVNSNDEWLPLACKYADTECPHPKEENGCWMQFLMQGGVDMREDNSSL